MSNELTQRGGAKLTEKQELFLEALFSDAKGVPEIAKEMAGYTKGHSVREIMNSFSDDLRKEVEAFVILNASRAAHRLIDIMEDPAQPGASTVISAANSLLDRAGITKRDKLEINDEAAIMATIVIPAKAKRQPLIDENVTKIE